ncbi:hypothetical protein EI94DRAFT_1813182 [Lactarius quietus]|nr:hypothetical protein EI94DRAFT_1813182 [Lactarius quietus]
MSYVPLTTITFDLPPVDTLTNYDSNNNVDDPFCSAVEQVRAVAEQDKQEREQQERDLAKARQRFPTPASGRVEDDEEENHVDEGGDAVMAAGSDSEDDSKGETDEDTVANEASILQPSTAATSTTAVDRYDSDDSSDADESYYEARVVCTRCDNPPNYCHCAPRFIPPPITRVDDESAEETSNAEGGSSPVAVVYGPMAEAGYTARGILPYSGAPIPSPTTMRRTNAARRPVRAVSPTPAGFTLNNGMNWVPMVIEHEGRRMPRQVDEALARLGDISLQAEVRRYRASQEVIEELEAAIKRLKDDLQRKCLHEHWKNCHDYPEAHTWEARDQKDIEEEEAVRTLVAAEDDSYLAYDEAWRVRQLMLAGRSLQDG